MKREFTSTQMRRAGWIGGGTVVAIALVPIVPAVASALSPASGSRAHLPTPDVIHLEVVAADAKLGPGQIRPLAAGAAMYIRCPNGRALGGGYALPTSDEPLALAGSMLVSAPDEQDPAKWDFRYSSATPAGTKFYATCWQG
jgi:hypothetical protein